jgi:hypothetical protein
VSKRFVHRAIARTNAALLAGLLTHCAGAPGGGGTPPGPSPSVLSISISGPSAFYLIGDSAIFSATETLSDGSSREGDALVKWATNGPGVLSVSSAGVVTAISAGSADVTISRDAVSASATVRVTPVTWAQMKGPDEDTGFLHIAADPGADGTIFVGTDNALYTTYDSGASWARPASGHITAIELDPASRDRVYAAAGLHTVLRSADRGHTYTIVQTFEDDISSFLVSGGSSHALYAGFGAYGEPHPSGVFVSTDAGDTWVRRPFGIAGALIPLDIAEDPIQDVLFVGTEIADHPNPYRPPFLVSPDEAQDWVDATGILPWHVIRISVDSHDHSVLALTEGAGLFTSSDGARSWTRLTSKFGLSLVRDRNAPERVFVGDLARTSVDGGVYISEDSGAHFVRFGLAGITVTDLTLGGPRPRLYAASYGNGLYVADLESPFR